MNDSVFGADGRGGDAARFRALKAKIDAETRAGQAQAAAKDHAEYAKLAASILASAKVMQAGSCKPRIVAQVNPGGANVAQGASNAGQPGAGAGPMTIPTAPPPPSGPAGLTTRSRHGCVSFNGWWQTASGAFLIRNAAGALGNFWFSGTVKGNVYSGNWAAPQPGDRGTFVFTLAPDGDSIRGVLTNSITRTEASWTAPCMAPLSTSAVAFRP
jgi:hypothetical protein